MTTLSLLPFHSPQDKGWNEAQTLYHASFPPKELRSDADHLRALADEAFEADGIWRDDECVGILYWWRLDNGSAYIEYLAVDPQLRGERIGSQVLTDFCRDRRVILEIDPPEEEIAVRRLHFYERVGFCKNPQLYIHPSYNLPFTPHRLVLMSYPTRLGREEARRFADFVRTRVMHYSEHEAVPDFPRI